ncbi:hypothetical protein ABZ896_04735 [Streptomyces sp. NPDC047072]|uniref:hypothetical protein n=1 Tax=Streptomyces sp. NPDC047072 TaxID=3154809 RepID=UPI0033F6770B
MSDDPEPGRAEPQNPNTSNGPGRTGLWIAVIGLLAAVAGPLVPVLVARSDDVNDSPARSSVAAVSTHTASDTTEPPDEPTDTTEPDSPDTSTPDPDADVRALTDLITSGSSSLIGCEESFTLDDEPLAAVSCGTVESDGPATVDAYSFASKPDLDNWMAGELGSYGETDGSTCDTGGNWRGTWSHDEVVIGDLACGRINGDYWMTWAFDDQLIVLDTSHTDAALLYSWWDSAPLTF